MATEIRLRRGTTAEHGNFNGAEGEITFDTDKHTLIVHNNEGNGTGRQIALLSDVQAEDTLAEMNDVNLTSPADGSVLKYDNASSKWIDSAKLTETATGIDVNGEVKGDTLDIDGNASIAGAISDVTTLTASGEIEGGSLDINGNADISGNLVLGGDLNVTGTTTTVNQTNLDVSDNIIGLNRGAGTNANDSGFIIERGSTGDNAVFVWDESADKFTLGTTTATPSSTGDLTIATGTLVANVEGNLTGTIQTAAQTNITSVGDLTALNVNGTVTADVLDVSGNTAGTNNNPIEVLSLPTNSKIEFDNTFSIQHRTYEDPYAYIRETGAGGLRIEGASVNLFTNDGSSDSAQFNVQRLNASAGASGSVKLYYGNETDFSNYKFETTSTGVNVAGKITATSSGIGDNDVAVFGSGVADDDFLRINGNEVEGLDASQVKSALSLAKADVGLGNVDNESKSTMFANPTFTGTTTAGSITAPQTIANYVTDTSIDVSEFANYQGKKIIYTGGGVGTIDLPVAVAGDVGKSWTIVNASAHTLTVNVDAGTAQFVRHLHAGGVNTVATDRTIASGGVVEIICTTDGSVTNSSTVPNYIIYGSGVI